MTSVTEKPAFELKLDSVALCVVPPNNRDEMEIQFHENDVDKEEDCLLQITLHFPPAEEDAGDEDDTPAQAFQKDVMGTGVVRSVTGDIICEFTKEQGNFVTPRGKYSMQMLSTYMHMQGANYSYKIKYSDITQLFLLDKPDGVRMAFIICLEKPIRQGSQKYQYLVLETHKLEHTLQINLSEEDIAKDYDGQLQKEMTMSMASLIAKIFKVLSKTTVYVPKGFKSFRNEFAVRCSYKTSEGLIYPLAKCIIFINKPTMVIKYEEIECIEFARYVPAANSATRNFDLVVTVMASKGSGTKSSEMSYSFTSIDRSEYSALFDFFNTKKVTIINPQAAGPAASFAGMDGDDDDDEEDEEDDGDYQGGNSEHSADSDDSGSDPAGSDEEEKPKASKKRPAAKSEPKAKKAKAGSDDEGTSKRAKRDSSAPKKAKSAFDFYASVKKGELKGENPKATAKEINDMINEAWRELEADEKEVYETMAEDDKDRYKREKASYVPAEDDDEDGGGKKAAKKKKAKKDPNAPKAPKSAYLFFGDAMRATVKEEQPGITPTEIMRELGSRWKALDASSKEPYEKLAKADKERNKTEVAAYKAKSGGAMEVDDDASAADDESAAASGDEEDD